MAESTSSEAESPSPAASLPGSWRRELSATGSCARCRRALDLASVKVDGKWYGREICATGGPCPLEESAPRVPEKRLINRPLRYFRKRAPKELRRASV